MRDWFGRNGLSVLLPLAVLIGGGVLIDLLPISGGFWLPVYLAAAFLAGRFGSFRKALIITLITSIIVLAGTAIWANDRSSEVGGRFPILETLLIVTLPMVLFTWLGSRIKKPSRAAQT